MSTKRTTAWILAATMAAMFLGRTAAAADEARSADRAVTRRIVVSLPDRKLVLLENDAIVSIYPVAVGAPVSPSPVGTRWIGLSAKGYVIHGTDNPGSIGYAKSHGCIRLRNHDVERLFERVRPGDVVELHAERTPEIERLFTESR